jgi:ureidoacrylate peracid hydrolase
MSSTQEDQTVFDRWSLQGDCISLVRPINKSRCISFSALPESLCVDMSHSVLIVIDMQNDFIDPEGWFASVRNSPVSQLSKVIPRINELSTAFRLADSPVIHLNWGVRADLANLPANVLDKGSACGRMPGYGDSIGSGNVLVQGSWGAESVPAIDIHESDICVNKHRLSGFRDNELEQILRRLNITTVFYTGINLDRCVFATLMDGCFYGFDAILVEDATVTVSPDYVSEAITYLIRLLYGFTTTSAELLLALEFDIKQGETT